ncbi:MAG: Sporulation initiation phosphotransferase F [Candidatus Dichloromethanomonas elyunquensis]|nr:MAG: Sporulation initiation phosphotransferase F [Candidatus Dichloromethanomonas elyunquensis]
MNKRILIVDDNRGVRFLLRELLRTEGYDVVEAANGREALYYSTLYDFPLVLLDVKMPGITGIDVLHRLKAQNPGLTVILMSAYSEMELLNMALEYHPKVLFLSKPFDLDNVRELIFNTFLFQQKMEFQNR